MDCKSETSERYSERINKVLCYIQDNIESNLSLDILSQVSCISPYHFHRVFKNIAGETLGQYIQRTKLEGAAFKLLYTDMQICDVAQSCGFKSPPVFTKAFKAEFGSSPSQYRSEQAFLLGRKSVPSVSDGSVRDEPRCKLLDIRLMQANKVAFVRKNGTYGDAASKAWDSLLQNTQTNNWISRNTEYYSITYDCPDITDDENMRYEACISVGDDAIAKGEIGIKNLPMGKFAVFLHLGSYYEFEASFRHIYTQWLPQSNEQSANIHGFMRHIGGFNPNNKEDAATEIFVPLQ